MFDYDDDGFEWQAGGYRCYIPTLYIHSEILELYYERSKRRRGKKFYLFLSALLIYYRVVKSYIYQKKKKKEFEGYFKDIFDKST